MKPRRRPGRVRFELRNVPRGYQPGYPARLTREEYELLILPGTRQRLHGLAAAMLLLGGGATAGGQQPEASREERILTLIRGLVTESSFWFPRASFVQDAEKGPHAVLPRIPIMFGNSINGVFDAGRARSLALEAFRVYGLEPRPDVRLELPGAQGVLDGLDEEHEIGFELSGLPGDVGFFGRTEAEPPEQGLDETECRALEQKGYRLHRASLGWYPVADGDSSPSQLAYLAGIVSFLNEVTDGPDVDLSAVLRTCRQGFRLPDASDQLYDGQASQRPDGTLVLRVRERSTLRIPFGRPGDPPPGKIKPSPYFREQEMEPLDAPRSTAGRPTLVRLDVSTESGPRRLGLRLTQEGEDGALSTDVRSDSGLLFVPGSFDAARPFTLKLELEPLRYIIGPVLEVGASAP